MNTLRVIIIDDEKHSRELLDVLLKKYCTDIEIVGVADSVTEGARLINNLQPDLIFLDIEMPDGNGFNLLENIERASFKTCFVTGYEQYALKAIKYGCIDYLLKPVEINELKSAVAKTKEAILNRVQETASTILVNDGNRITVVIMGEIISITADNNYSIIQLENKKILSTDNLLSLENALETGTFFRTHKSHIINMDCISQLIPGRAMSVEMNNGETIPVAARRKKEFMEAFNKR